MPGLQITCKFAPSLKYIFMKTAFAQGTIMAVVSFLLPFTVIGQTNGKEKIINQTGTFKTKNRMDYKVNIGRIDVPKASIEEFRTQSSQTPIYLRTLPGFVKDDYYEMTDDLGNLHMMSVTVWENDGYYKKAQEALKKHYEEIHFNRMDFVQHLGLTVKYDAYSVLEIN
jgi:heme-degrading monooxygenase HmoA